MPLPDRRARTISVLFTDMVGSTAIASRLGADAADEGRRGHFSALRAAIEGHGGDEVKSTGDGVMCVFESVTEAVDCAIAMQRAVHELLVRSDDAGALRVGVSVGEVTAEEGDWYGAPVVEAARLCDAAQTGQILVADVVRRLAASRGRHRFRAIDALELKGFTDPFPAAEVLWEPESRTMRVVVADDAVLVRDGVARVLDAAGFAVVGQAGTPEDLLRLVAEHEPDVAVVDIRMPPTHTTEGLRAAREIRAKHPRVGVLLLSQHLVTDYALDLLGDAAGIGYLLKERVSDLDEFAEAVRRVGEGGAVVDPEIGSRLLGRRRKDDALGALSDRERDVLSLMAEGRSNRAIAERLFVTEKTIEAHVGNIFTKLGLEPAPDDHRRVLAVLTFLRSHGAAPG